jgi:hypothetical protein
METPNLAIMSLENKKMLVILQKQCDKKYLRELDNPNQINHLTH